MGYVRIISEELGVNSRVAQGDLYELKLGGRFLGQATLNVFHYYQSTESINVNYATQLLQQWSTYMVNDGSDTPWTSVAFSDNWEIMSLATRNLFNESEIADSLIGGIFPGTSTVANAGTFQAYHFATNRPNGAIRRGHKYFGGLPGGVSVDGILVPTVTAALAEMVTRLGASIVVDVGEVDATFLPVIVKRIREEPDAQHDNVWYRLPENSLEAVWFTADTWSLDDRLTTMNSRKLGRGV